MSETPTPPRTASGGGEHLHVVLDGWTRQKLDELARGTSAKAVVTSLVQAAYSKRQEFLRQQFSTPWQVTQ